MMKIDTEKLASELASDNKLSDYDFWRALKTVNNEIFTMSRNNAPIPIEVVRLRAILKKARAKRKGGLR
jgi:hypothetical protein